MRKLVAAPIVLYQRCISPFLPPACRFQPSCSEYAREAILLHGALKGVLLTLWRLARCHPLCKAGYDPVPEPGSWRGTGDREETQGIHGT